MYDVIIRSDSPVAKPFRKWVISEVLPTIRKHGMYATPATIDAIISDPEFGIKLLSSLKQERQKRLEAEDVIKTQAPKVLFADAVATSDRSILVSELAKILKQNGVEIGQNRLFTWLREHGYLCSKGEYYNQPSQKAMELGLFEIKKTSITKPDGCVFVTCTTKVTGKGQVYFVNRFMNMNAPVESIEGAGACPA
jgi:anti-repressor protein